MDPWLQGISGGAAIAAAFAIIKLIFDGAGRHTDRLLDLEERSRGHERDTESRFERALRDVADRADHRAAEQADALATERARRIALERECAALRQAQRELHGEYQRLWHIARTLLVGRGS
jgi:hypothetical protein